MSTASYTAWLFHETYERLAPDYGYEVRADVGQRPFSELPDNNRNLMIATAQEVVAALRVEEMRSALEVARDFIKFHPAVQGKPWPLVTEIIEEALHGGAH